MRNIYPNVNPDFAEWATRFSGCDGGNLHGAIWLCGAEWGGTEDASKVNFKQQIDSVRQCPYRMPEITEHILKNSRNKFIFDQRAFKLISVIASDQQLQELNYVKEYARQYITYTEISQFFKLNLFPISFKCRERGKSGWVREGWVAKTGCPTHDDYLEWCREYRFPEIKKWFVKGSPKLIIYAYKDSMQDFFRLFGSSKTPDWNSEPIEGRNLDWTITGSSKTILAVFPMYSPYPKNEQISSAGLRIREICDKELGDGWLPKSLLG